MCKRGCDPNSVVFWVNQTTVFFRSLNTPNIRPDIILCPNNDSNAPAIWWFIWCHSEAVEDGWGSRKSSTVLGRCDPKECQSSANTGLPLFWLLSGVNSFVFLSCMKEELLTWSSMVGDAGKPLHYCQQWDVCESECSHVEALWPLSRCLSV